MLPQVIHLGKSPVPVDKGVMPINMKEIQLLVSLKNVVSNLGILVSKPTMWLNILFSYSRDRFCMLYYIFSSPLISFVHTSHWPLISFISMRKSPNKKYNRSFFLHFPAILLLQRMIGIWRCVEHVFERQYRDGTGQISRNHHPHTKRLKSWREWLPRPSKHTSNGQRVGQRPHMYL